MGEVSVRKRLQAGEVPRIIHIPHGYFGIEAQIPALQNALGHVAGRLGLEAHVVRDQLLPSAPREQPPTPAVREQVRGNPVPTDTTLTCSTGFLKADRASVKAIMDGLLAQRPPFARR